MDPQFSTSDRTAFIQTSEYDPINRRPSRWRPLYLRPWLLLSFAGAFVGLAVPVEVLIAVSDRSNGLATAPASLRYFWTYGPAVIFTLVAVVWCRVEFQAKMVAAWSALYDPKFKTSALKEAGKRDYLGTNQPTAIYRSIRNRDFTVTATAGVSIFLVITIIFSTGLISLSPTVVVKEGIPISVKSRFAQDSELRNASDLKFTEPLYPSGMSLMSLGNNGLLIALRRQKVPYPLGLTRSVAYQTPVLSANDAMIPDKGTLVSEVDGMLQTLECEAATATFERFAKYPKFGVNVTFNTADCEMKAYLDVHRDAENGDKTLASLRVGNCGGEDWYSGPSEKTRFGLLFASVKVQNTAPMGNGMYSSNFTVLKSAQVLCKPTYNISRYLLTQVGNRFVSLTPAPESTPKTVVNFKPKDLHAWDMSEVYLKAHGPRKTPGDSIGGYSESIHTDFPHLKGMLFDMFWEWALLSSPDLPADYQSSFFDVNSMEGFFKGYYESYMAAIAHYLLPTRTIPGLTATVLEPRDRIIVQPVAGHVISVLLGISGLVALAIGLVRLRAGSSSVLPRNPCSAAGSAALLAGVEYQLVHHRENSHYSGETHKPRHPPALHPVSRLTMCTLIAGLIITLSVLLNQSRSHNGLGPASSPDTQPYLHYLWTALPAVVLSLIGIYLATVDTQIRTLTPYLEMARPKGASYARSLGIDLLDKYQLTAIYSAARVRLFPAVVTGLVAGLAAVLPILSASLYREQHFAVEYDSKLDITTAFTTERGAEDRSPYGKGVDMFYTPLLANMILQHNTSYPPFTYQDLAFPSFQFNDYDFPGNKEDISTTNESTPSLAIDATIPALRSGLSCRLYDRSDMQFAYKYRPDGTRRQLRVNITGEPCRGSPDNGPGRIDPATMDQQWGWSNFAIGDGTDRVMPSFWPALRRLDGVFGLDGTSSNMRDQTVIGCSGVMFAWGSFSPSNARPEDDPFKAVYAMGCNRTVEMVDVDVRFLLPSRDRDLEIDTVSKPPRVIESSKRPVVNEVDWTFNNETEQTFYYTMLDPVHPAPPGSQLGSFFRVLTTSRYAIPSSKLGKPRPSRAELDEITRAIRLQYSIGITQDISALRRIKVDNSNFVEHARQKKQPSLMIDGRNSSVPFPAVVSITGSGGGGTEGAAAGRMRVVQDAASTQALIAVLAVILVLSVVAWIMTRHTDVFPGSPTNVAHLYRLLSAGNLLDRLMAKEDADVDGLDDGEVERLLRGGGMVSTYFVNDSGDDDTGHVRFRLGPASVQASWDDDSSKDGTKSVVRYRVYASYASEGGGS